MSLESLEGSLCDRWAYEFSDLKETGNRNRMIYRRTSSPTPGVKERSLDLDPHYEIWKRNLEKPPTSIKLRGTDVAPAGIVAGLINISAIRLKRKLAGKEGWRGKREAVQEILKGFDQMVVDNILRDFNLAEPRGTGRKPEKKKWSILLRCFGKYE